MKLSDLGEAYKDIRKLLSELQSGRAMGLYCPSLIAERQRQFLHPRYQNHQSLYPK